MIKRIALIEPVPSTYPYPVFRSRRTTLALLSIVAVGAALRFWTALADPLLPHLPQTLIGVATIGMVFLVARDAFGTSAGILSALLYALSATAAIQSFLDTSNAPAVFFALLSIYFGIAAWNGGREFHSALAGVCIGLAAGLDWHAVPLGIFPLLANLTADRARKRRRIAVFAALALLACGLAEAPNLTGLAADWPNIRWDALVREIHWSNLAWNIPLGAGWPLAAAGLAGWIWMGYRLFSKRDFPRSRVNEPYIFALIWFFGCGFVFFAQIFMRSDNSADAHAALPLVAILAGCLLTAYGTHPNETIRRAGTAAGVMIALYSFVYASAHVNLYRTASPSESASEWIERNVPRGELVGIARNDAWTPECLTGHHPNFEVLEGGGTEAPLEVCLRKLDEIGKEAKYLVVNEIEYRAAQEIGLADSIFAKDFTETARFDRRASFLGVEFPKNASAPADWLARNASIIVFARKKAEIPA